MNKIAPNKNLHADTYCYARFCVCRSAPFFYKNAILIAPNFATHCGVRSSSLAPPPEGDRQAANVLGVK